MAQVEGSGTTEPDSENAALNGPWSGDVRADAQPVGFDAVASLSSRVQLCRS